MTSVSTDYNGGMDITRGKRYPARQITERAWEIYDDVGFRLAIILTGCPHIHGRDWTLHND